MNRSEKQETVETLNREFSESSSVILVEFNRINVPNITELRDRIRAIGSDYKVVKNRLALRAAVDTPVENVKDSLQGPTAIAFTQSDAVALAKVLKEFAKDNEGLKMKAAVVEGQPLSISQVEELAEMPSREELLSKLVFLLKAPLNRLASGLQSPLRDLGSVLRQVAGTKKE